MLEVTEVSATSLSGNTSVSSNIEVVTGMDRKFYEAALKGNINVFKGIGNEIESILTPNRNNILHIHFTNYSDGISEAFVEEILRMCPTLVMKANAKGETLLHIAARYGHSKMVNILIERDRRLIRATNDEMDTALHEAVCYHHSEIVDILTKEDPDYSYFGNSDGETPLYIAAEREYWDAMLIILQNCKSPNQNGPNGRTALHAAIIRQNKEMVSKLLPMTSAKQADENGWVPLHLAALHWSPDLVEVLLKHDKNTAYMRDKKGRTALHFAAHFGSVSIMEKIIEYCPDCSELVDERGYNALHYCVGDLPATNWILSNESLRNLYNEKDDSGNTPLHHFATKFHNYASHPLLGGHSRVNTTAFNKQNESVFDVAYKHHYKRRTKKLILENLRDTGARFGGRIIIKKDVKKEKEDEGDDSAIPREKNQDKGHDSTIQIEKKQEEINYDLITIEKVREANFIVATLIATVTFTAVFTLPGGNVQEHDQPNKGSPILKHNAAFQAFVITDAVAFVLSASAVLCQIFSSIFPEQPYVNDDLVGVALVLTMLAMVFMVIAFVTGTYAVLSAPKALAIVTVLIGLSFFITFVLFSWEVHKMRTTTTTTSTSVPEKEQEFEYYNLSVADRHILKAEEI